MSEYHERVSKMAEVFLGLKVETLLKYELENLDPGDVFSTRQLNDWARANRFIRADEARWGIIAATLHSIPLSWERDEDGHYIGNDFTMSNFEELQHALNSLLEEVQKYQRKATEQVKRYRDCAETAGEFTDEQWEELRNALHAVPLRWEKDGEGEYLGRRFEVNTHATLIEAIQSIRREYCEEARARAKAQQALSQEISALESRLEESQRKRARLQQEKDEVLERIAAILNGREE